MTNKVRDFIEGRYSISEIWDESAGTCSDETREDIQRLRNRIAVDARKRKRIRTFIGVATGCAACIAVAVLSSVITWRMKTIDYVQLSSPVGKNLTASLPDKSTVVLQPGSSVIYPERFVTGKRTVFMTGEADFTVSPDHRKPFIVKTQYMDIEALGTRFRVQAYSDDYVISTILIEGKVKVDVKADSVESFILKPGNMIKYIPSENDIQLLDIGNGRMASLRNGDLIFQKASFTEIAQGLERRYGVEISYDSEILGNNSLYIRFRADETLAEALDMLTMMIPGSHYTVSGDRVYFRTR